MRKINRAGTDQQQISKSIESHNESGLDIRMSTVAAGPRSHPRAPSISLNYLSIRHNQIFGPLKHLIHVREHMNSVKYAVDDIISSQMSRYWWKALTRSDIGDYQKSFRSNMYWKLHILFFSYGRRFFFFSDDRLLFFMF